MSRLNAKFEIEAGGGVIEVEIGPGLDSYGCRDNDNLKFTIDACKYGNWRDEGEEKCRLTNISVEEMKRLHKQIGTLSEIAEME